MVSGRKTYRDHVINLANRILSGYSSQPVSGLPEALSVILTAIGENVMAGTDQVPEPGRSTVEQCSVCVCFMAACSVTLISKLNDLGYEVAVSDLMHQAGNRVFVNHTREDQRVIVDSGVLLFKEMIQEAGSSRKLTEWMGSVHNITDRYVLTEGLTDCTDLFAPLYLVLLMATKQISV
ncbi:MAG TPA: hypothetical protein PKM95_05470 [Deltaproteobacteria bacterium]|nr:hypothetical protein [Deltaproteobacteria bacterium]